MALPSLYNKVVQEKSFLSTLQAGRGIAALFVILFHLSTTIFAHDNYWGRDPLGGLFNFGRAGVEFFFVLSGFVMLQLHWNDFNEPSRAIPYLKKRFCRIYPIYWVILVSIIPVYFFSPTFGHGHEREAGVILSAITLVHISSGYTVLTVAWTLYHEVMFYVVFSISILNRKIGLFVLTAWIAGSVFRISSEDAETANEFLHSAFDYFFSPLHLLFALGMIACWVLRRNYVRAPAFFAVFGVVLYLCVGMDENYSNNFSRNGRILGYGIGCAVALVGFIALETEGRLRAPKALSFLGDASYSMYLTHLVVISLLAKLFIVSGAKNHLPAIVSYFAILLGALLVGGLVHVLIEKPLLRRVSKIIGV